MAEKKGIKGLLKKAFGAPEEEDDRYEPAREVSVGYTLWGDMEKPTQQGEAPYTSRESSREEVNKMQQTNIKSDVSAYSASGVDMELMRPRFSFEGGLSLESVTAHSSDVINALKDGKTVLLDLYDLGDDERLVMTYVVLGAVNALGYTITNIRDHMIFALTPSGVEVSQDERVRLDNSDDASNLRYSNDYR